jgi:acetyl esterase/lipase
MVSLQGRALFAIMKLLYFRLLPPHLDIATLRKGSQQPLAEPMPRDIRWETGNVAGIPGEWITPPNAETTPVLLYLHGGGYVIKTPHVHRVMVGRLARAAGMRAFMVDYRLAPEHPFPAALHDAAASYRGLLTQGVAPSQIVVVGDSAGGGLTAALLLHLRDSGEPFPAAAGIISGLLDCTFSDPAATEYAQRDPFLRLADVKMMAMHYAGAENPAHPLLSPVFADLHGLPPLLIYAGEHECLYPDAVRIAAQAEAAGVDVTLRVWAGMLHAFPIFAGFVPEGRQALTEMGAFLRRHVH